MATQGYVTELQAAQQQSQQQPESQQQPAATANTTSPVVVAAATQQQYVAELQGSQQQQQQSTPKQYVTEISTSPPTGQQTSMPAPQQYIVVTVSEGSMRPSDTISESSPGSTATQSGVPTQVVQQVQGTQQRLLVQASVQTKPGTVSPLQLTSVQVPPQRLVVQNTPQTSKGGSIALTVHGVQQVHSSPENQTAYDRSNQKDCLMN